MKESATASTPVLEPLPLQLLPEDESNAQGEGEEEEEEEEEKEEEGGGEDVAGGATVWSNGTAPFPR